MSLAPSSLPYEKVSGHFKHIETKAEFDFANDADGSIHPFDTRTVSEYPCVLFLDQGQQTRRCKLSKTRAYVVVNENEYGDPIVETWPIKFQWKRTD